MISTTLIAALAFNAMFPTLSEAGSVNDPIEYGRLTIMDAAANSSGGVNVVGSLTKDQYSPPYGAHYSGGNLQHLYEWFGVVYSSSPAYSSSSLYGDYPTVPPSDVDSDSGEAICIDSNGVSYVGGTVTVGGLIDPTNYITVVKASGLSFPTGKSASSTIYNYATSGHVTDLDAGDGYVYMLATAGGNFFVAKLDPSNMQTAKWTRSLSSTGITPVQIKYHGGAAYVLGTVGGEYYLAKITDNGTSSTLNWEYTYDGTGEGTLAAREMVVRTISSTVNIFITGTENTLAAGNDIRTIRVADGGTSASLTWSKVYDGSYVQHITSDTAAGIALDSSNNVYVGGTGHAGGGSKSTPAKLDYLALYIPLAGSSQTVTNYEFSSGATEQAVSVGMDSQDRFHIFGTTTSSGTPVLGTVFYSYSSGFSNLGAFTKAGVGTSTTAVKSVVQSDDSVFVVGQSLNSDGVKTGLIVKYDW